MTLKVIGAGLGRTATSSLKQALELLLDAPCYHMAELAANQAHASFWLEAAHGGSPDWASCLNGYAAGVDYPICVFWRELSEAFPDALILLSRRSAESWYQSASKTIYAPRKREPGPLTDLSRQINATRFPIHDIIGDKAASMALFNQWNESVIAEAPAHRLLIWEAQDGWEPICDALDLPVPDVPFPFKNTQTEFIKKWLDD